MTDTSKLQKELLQNADDLSNADHEECWNCGEDVNYESEQGGLACPNCGTPPKGHPYCKECSHPVSRLAQHGKCFVCGTTQRFRRGSD